MGPRYHIYDERGIGAIWDKAVRYGFDKIIGPALDAIVRRPMFVNAYVKSYADNLNTLAFFLGNDLFSASGLTQLHGSCAAWLLDLHFGSCRGSPWR
jgi:hypothetical protein